ncbi:MAG: Dabb family protein [Blastochloris sp.]|nr:Dabb family protein [Blastochloris sp.]
MDRQTLRSQPRCLTPGRRRLADIPGTLNFRIGPPTPSPRAVVDDSFAVAISMDFNSQAEADLYQSHPIHQEFIETCVKPYAKRLVVYDFGA